jgi:hypothetical protein
MMIKDKVDLNLLGLKKNIGNVGQFNHLAKYPGSFWMLETLTAWLQSAYQS